MDNHNTVNQQNHQDEQDNSATKDKPGHPCHTLKSSFPLFLTYQSLQSI